MVQFKYGGTATGYYEHNAPIGQIAEEACRRAQMNNL